MNRRETYNDAEESLRQVTDGLQSRIWTALPGEVVSFDPVAQTVVVQPTIQGRVTATDGSAGTVDLPLLLDCPVVFPSGGGATFTFPIEAGDECLVVFSSRCIDAWWQQGGVQPPMEHRLHDLSDGFVIVGPRSQPRRLSGVSTSAAQLRSDDGSTVVELDPTAQTLTLTAPGGATINADTVINGTLHVTGKITTDDDVEAVGDVKAGSISLKTHKHSGVAAGAAQTGGPV